MFLTVSTNSVVFSVSIKYNLISLILVSKAVFSTMSRNCRVFSGKTFYKVSDLAYLLQYLFFYFFCQTVFKTWTKSKATEEK